MFVKGILLSHEAEDSHFQSLVILYCLCRLSLIIGSLIKIRAVCVAPGVPWRTCDGHPGWDHCCRLAVHLEESVLSAKLSPNVDTNLHTRQQCMEHDL